MNSSNPLNLVAAVMVLVFVPGLLILGVAGALSETGTMQIVFMLLAAAATAMGIGGVQMIVRWRRAVREESEHQRAIRAAVGGPPPAPFVPPWLADSRSAPAMQPVSSATVAERPAATVEHAAPSAPPAAAPSAPAARTLPSGEPVLAHWTYAADEWKAYTRKEWRGRIIEAFAVGIGVFLLGLLIGRNDPDGVVKVAAAMVALLMIAGRLLKAGSAKQGNESGPGEAIITPTAILLNGEYHVLANDTFRFQGVRYVDTARPPVLEFTVTWSTRSGPTNEQINVPIPAGREAEARAIIAAFQRGWAVEV